MADNVQIKKFLDHAGVGTLWTRVTEEINKVDVKAGENAAAIAAHGTRMDEIDRTIAKVREDFEKRDGELNDAILANAGDIEINAGAIQVLNGDANTAGSVAKAVADAEGRVDVKLKAITDDMGDVDDLATTNKVLVAAINEVRNAVSAGGTAAAITMTSDTTTEGALKSYTIKQGDNVIGTIDIPKDMVVESGEVVTNPEGQDEGTYIKLVLANVAEPLYVNVGNLVDIYKAAAGAAQVQVAIDSVTREISASIVAGSINTTELADNAVVTAKIADANVTKAKLSAAVQASLDKADAAATKAEFDAEVLRAQGAEAQALADAKAYTDEKVGVEKLRAEGVEGNLNTRLQAVEAKFGSGEGNVESQIAAAKQAAIDAAATDAQNKANAAAAAAQAHADGLNTAMNKRVEVLEAIDHTKFEAAGAAAAAESNAKAYTDTQLNATIMALTPAEILAAIAEVSAPAN